MLKLINCESYKDLCDWVYDDEEIKTPPKSCVCYVPNDHIAAFFKNIEGSPHKFIVISARSDYGICYQHQNPVAQDMLKWIEFKVRPQDYNPLVLAPRCNLDECYIKDLYSIKMEYYTKATFNYIPENVVHWFIVNCNLPPHPKITKLPFGVPNNTTNDIFERELIKRDNRIYVNFQLYTVQRVYLLEKLKHAQYCKIKALVPYEQYIKDLHTYKYALAPNGNGWDTYRILEAIYAGCIPIVESDYWAQAYEGLPIIFISDMFGLSEEVYNKLPQVEMSSFKLENSKADFNYWAAQIKEKRKLLLI